jgi:hypothetical protein
MIIDNYLSNQALAVSVFFFVQEMQYKNVRVTKNQLYTLSAKTSMSALQL